MQKVLLIGGSGMLGSDLKKVFQTSSKIQLLAPTHSECDITNLDQVKKIVDQFGPKALINSAAYNFVDQAEDDAIQAFQINAEGPKILAQLCQEKGIKLIHYSTDYVFDGSKNIPYVEEDLTHPLSIYGESKEKGEKNIQKYCEDYLILRVAWLFGAHGKNFIKTILKLAQEKEVISVVNDQVGSPTSTIDLAQATFSLIKEKIPSGIYHVVNSGFCSWYELACEAISLALGKKNIKAISSSHYPTKAKRPFYTVLSTQKINAFGFISMPSWQEALKIFLNGN